MRSREEIREDIAESNAENNGNETVRLLQLEVLLDIRDLLVEIRDQYKEVVVDFVPPDYGREEKL